VKSPRIVALQLGFVTALLAVISLPALAQNQPPTAAPNSTPAQTQTPAQTPAQTRIRALVVSFDAPALTVKTEDGDTLIVTVPSDLRIMANATATLADIKPGDFVGSAADKGPDGKLHAEEVHIFPEAMRGTGEGHRPMGPDPNRSMTNGTVSAAPPDPEARTMTNGTVSAASGDSSRTITIQYDGGVQEIEVGPDVPIITLVVGDASLLKPGAEVSIVAVQKDGALVATRLTAEKDGVKPR
jgi:Cu/Ag efflux protein CusF